VFVLVCLLSDSLAHPSPFSNLTNATNTTLFKNTHTTTKVKHAKLAEATEEAVADPSKVNVKLKPENVDIAYPPIFQSGVLCALRRACVVRVPPCFSF
jgi:hypothetical protein